LHSSRGGAPLRKPATQLRMKFSAPLALRQGVGIKLLGCTESLLLMSVKMLNNVHPDYVNLSASVAERIREAET